MAMGGGSLSHHPPPWVSVSSANLLKVVGSLLALSATGTAKEDYV
jgi:hypothetical protein